MTRTYALRFVLAALAGLAMAGCSNSSAPESAASQPQPEASEQPAPIEFPAPKDVEQRAKQREAAAQGAAAQASSSQTVGGELGDMYKHAQKSSPAPTASAAH